MANKIFVSPGVFTSEKDLTFVAQSVGVTTLGIVGETTKGPAFDPVFITNYDDFKAIFGGLNPEKFKGSPAVSKFQAPYVAKSYLEESNQLFVTRVLGFTGYDAGDAWIISAASSASTVNGQVLTVIRSRGKYSSNTLSHDVSETGDTCATTGLTATIAAGDVKGDFTLTAATASGNQIYDVSLDSTKKNYISKVLGTTPTDRDDTVLYVEDIYPALIKNADTIGSGLTTSILAVDDFKNYQGKFQTPQSPYVVSELRGNKVFRLFRTISISDGDSANKEIKISIVNIDFNNKTFDIIVRGFGDTDANLQVLEQFTRCDMNPASDNYIGKRVGTLNGEYALRSNYIMIEMADSYPTDAFPAGFEGVEVRDYLSGCTCSYTASTITNLSGSTVVGSTIVQTGNTTSFYNAATDYFATAAGGYELSSSIVYGAPTTIITLGSAPSGAYTVGSGTSISVYHLDCTTGIDLLPPKATYNTSYDTLTTSIRKEYLGFSNISGIDESLFTFKGFIAGSAEVGYPGRTQGFHMDSGATTATIAYLGTGATTTSFVWY